MLTGDMNILSVELIVQFRIRDAKQFLFNVANLGETIMKATEAAIRQVVGESHVDEALTTGKAEIQQKTQDLLQKILDDYGAGVQVAAIQLQDVDPPDQVAGAFKDVASAKEDKEKQINQSESYRNDIIPKAKGEAAQIVNQAQAYAQARVRRAEGEAARFNLMLREYQQNKKVIRTRLYLETMEEVLPGIDKIVIDKNLRPLFDVSSDVIDGNPQARSAHMKAVYGADVAATNTLLTMVGGKVVFTDPAL